MIVVEPPATSANLGPGFDCLGLALELRDRVSFTLAETTTVQVSGEGAGEVNRGPDHLVLATFRRAFEVSGLPVPEVSVGLGSSSAAIIAGLAGARALGAYMDDEELLALATDIEGHPDNVAPALLGGLTIAWMQDAQGRALSLQPALGLTATVAIPEQRLPTTAARTLLPAQIPFQDAVHAAGRSALAVAAFTGHPELLLPATEDRLHQDYRRSAYPQSWELVQELRSAGVPAAISGAGPTVIAFAADIDVPSGWRREHVHVASQGVIVGEG
ncbi:MAG: homoserine kinase [Candidatus Nanopelagicales bacterium]|nr:homoserine kinase [Candidatus Nanopelagicales bacterium]